MTGEGRIQRLAEQGRPVIPFHLDGVAVSALAATPC